MTRTISSKVAADRLGQVSIKRSLFSGSTMKTDRTVVHLLGSVVEGMLYICGQ